MTLWSLIPWFLPQAWPQESQIKCFTNTNFKVCISKGMENNGFSLLTSSRKTAVSVFQGVGEEEKEKQKKTKQNPFAPLRGDGKDPETINTSFQGPDKHCMSPAFVT